MPLDEVGECISAESVQYLLSPDSNGRYFLHNWASRSTNGAALPMLLQAGAAIDVIDQHGNTPLHIAAHENVWPDTIVDALLQHGADPNTRNFAGETPLQLVARMDGFWESYEGYEAAAVMLLRHGADPNVPSGYRDAGTVLHRIASFAENPLTVAMTLEAGADLEARNEFGNTPLHLANDASNVAALVAAGANVEARGEFGRTPLHFAANGDPESLRVLIDAGANLEARDDVNGETALHVAAGWANDPESLRVLIDAGANLDARNERGATPLHRVVSVRGERSAFYLRSLERGTREPQRSREYSDAEDPEFLEMLLVAGADPEARDNLGTTPLHHAAEQARNPSIISTLIAAGADLEARDDHDFTPLIRAAAFASGSAIVEALLDAGANPRVDYSTALSTAAVYNSNLEVISILFERTVDPEDRVETSTHTLWSAAEFNENPDVIRYFINAGADLNDNSSGSGRSPIHRAALNGNPAIIDVLIDAGADPNERTIGGGWTPLFMAAAFNENPAIIEILINAGAAVEARSQSGSTALHVAARQTDNPSMIEALLNAGADPTVRDDEGSTVWDVAQRNDAIRDSHAFWMLNDARFNAAR